MNDRYALIPYPQSLTPSHGKFVWQNPPLHFDDHFAQAAAYLNNHLPPPLTIQKGSHRSSKINLTAIIPLNEQSEAYRLKITPTHIDLCAASPSGMFYAVQTLLQLINAQTPAADTDTIYLPCLEINDEPRFSWRGFMLDEARHFQGKETVKQLLDWMAYLKLNTFHWHLTDDQGWRLEIKAFPRLTEVGSQREKSQTGGFLNKTTNNQPHSGFYTQDDIREIVAYAAERHITIVPEIEMPGHCQAALAAYPSFGCTSGPYQVQPYWGIHAEIFCPGKKEMIPFLETILKEVTALFPGKYIHLGGDEAPKKRWKNCPDCQALARQLGLSDVRGLQTYLVNHFTQFLAVQDRCLIGWNENLSPQLSPQALVQFWLGKKTTLWQHTRAGRKTILSNYDAYYLDHSYLHSPLEQVYRCEPISADLEPVFHKNILGIEAPLWTEFVPTRARLDWQVFPRLLAVAETAWLSAEKKNYCSFETRLLALLPQLDRDDIRYAPPAVWNPPRWKRLWGWPSLLQAQTGSVREK